MKTTNKILIGVVVGIILLIITALAVTLLRPKPTYQSEDTPEGVINNYLLALQNEDYERAYNYLSPTLKGYPISVREFSVDVHNSSYWFDRGAILKIESTTRTTGGYARVTVLESRFYQDGLFNSGQNINSFVMELIYETGEWNIIDSRYYFDSCWDYGCD